MRSLEDSRQNWKRRHCLKGKQLWMDRWGGGKAQKGVRKLQENSHICTEETERYLDYPQHQMRDF